MWWSATRGVNFPDCELCSRNGSSRSPTGLSLLDLTIGVASPGRAQARSRSTTTLAPSRTASLGWSSRLLTQDRPESNPSSRTGAPSNGARWPGIFSENTPPHGSGDGDIPFPRSTFFHSLVCAFDAIRHRWRPVRAHTNEGKKVSVFWVPHLDDVETGRLDRRGLPRSEAPPPVGEWRNGETLRAAWPRKKETSSSLSSANGRGGLLRPTWWSAGAASGSRAFLVYGCLLLRRSFDFA